jgi:membrane protease YdiL (CAAX protease family)
MEVEPKTRAEGTPAISPALTAGKPAVASPRRRYLVWGEIIVVFLFLELALWAPTARIRIRWAAIISVTILALVMTDALIGGSSQRRLLRRLGLGLPRLFGASVTLGIGLLMAAFMLLMARWVGGRIPANPTWFPNLRSAWGYVLWSLIQEFILQSFFFNRFEELYGSSAAVWIASALFAFVHLPSPVLTVATFIGSLFFCEMFRRYRSIYPLAIVHAMLGLTIVFTIPDSLLHHMRVGLGYLRY